MGFSVSKCLRVMYFEMIKICIMDILAMPKQYNTVYNI